MVKVDIENIIASATLSKGLDLGKIADSIEGAEYNPDRFPGVVLKFESPRVVVLLFEKGKMMCTGGRSLEDVQKVMDNVHETLMSQNLLDNDPGQADAPADSNMEPPKEGADVPAPEPEPPQEPPSE